MAPLAAFAATMLATVPFSIWPSGALSTFTELFLKVVLVFMLLAHSLSSPRLLRRFTWLIVVAMGYIAARGWIDYASGSNLLQGERLQGAVPGLMGNPNDLAMNMVTFLPFAAFAALTPGRTLARLFAAGVTLLMLGTILFAKSRGGFLALAVTGLLIVLQAGRLRPGLAAAILVGALVAPPILPQSFWTRVSSIVNPEDDDTGSRGARVTLLQDGWNAFLEHPFTGVGAGQFQNYNPPDRQELWRETHNVELQVLSELGLIGFGVFVWLLVRSADTLFRTWNALRPRRRKGGAGLADRRLRAARARMDARARRRLHRRVRRLAGVRAVRIDRLPLDALLRPRAQRRRARDPDPAPRLGTRRRRAWSRAGMNGLVSRLRVAIVAPTLEILGGHSVQAAALLAGLAARSRRSTPGWCRSTRAPPAWLARAARRRYVRTLVTQLTYWPLLWRELRRADVVHVFSASYTSFLLAPLPAWLVARVLGKPVLLNYHSGEAADHLRRSRLARTVLRRIGTTIVPSRFLVEVFARFGLAAEAIPNVIDRERFAFRRRERLRPRLLSTRNFEANYNVACTLRAFARVQARHPDATLTVVGSGSEAPALHALAAWLRPARRHLRRPRRPGGDRAPLRRRRHLRPDAGRRQHAAVGARGVRERPPRGLDRRRRRPRDADRRRARPARAARRRRGDRRPHLPPARGARSRRPARRCGAPGDRRLRLGRGARPVGARPTPGWCRPSMSPVAAPEHS